MNGVLRRVAAMVALLSGAACASGNYPDLPTEADYARSCSELIDAYVKADTDYKDRRGLTATTNAGMAAGTVAAVAASAATAGIPIIVGSVLFTAAKGDMGAARKAQERETLRQIAVHNGCTSADVDLRREAQGDASKAPAASAETSPKSGRP